VTLTSIEYFPAIDTYKVFVRMYFDDFLLDYKLCGKEFEELDLSANNASARDLMEEYIGEKIIIKVNDKELSGKLHDIKIVDNEVSMNLEYKSKKTPETITVKNMIMTNLYNDQANMLIVRINDFEEGAKLTSDKTEQTFNIK
jgi:hypothetical protein